MNTSPTNANALFTADANLPTVAVWQISDSPTWWDSWLKRVELEDLKSRRQPPRHLPVDYRRPPVVLPAPRRWGPRGKRGQ